MKAKFLSYSHFLLINCIFAILIGARYLAFLPRLPEDGLGQIFMVLSTFSQMALLALAVGVVFLPSVWLPTVARRLVISVGATAAIIILVIDTIVFSQYRFHINAVVVELLMAGQIVSFPASMWVVVIAAVVLTWMLQYGILRALETRDFLKKSNVGRYFAAAVVLAVLATNMLHVWGAAHAQQSVTQMKRYLPLFYPATSNSFMKKHGWVDEAALEKQKLLTMNEPVSDFKYPLKPLEKSVVEKPVNIVFLLIDSWRADSFNAENSPNIWKFSQAGMTLDKHISTGNATRVGIFGLFYSLPGMYWHSAIDHRASPVFMDRMQELNYQMGIFASAQLRNPEFNKTVFSRIPNLREESRGATMVERDENITDEWVQWFQKKDKSKPSFSFLFYDSPHGYEFPKNYAHRYEPLLEEVDYLKRGKDTDPIPWMNRYKTSVHYVDSLAKKVLDQLTVSGEMDHTIVIISGDHGEEINDNGLNYWGHNSNYSDVQTHVPFVMVGKGIPAGPSWQGKMTSHADVVPTLMKNYLGIQNPLEEYSTGENLLGEQKTRPWLLTSGYSSYAIVTDHDIVEVGAVGQYQHVDKKYHPLDTSPNFTYLQQALDQLRRFSKAD